MRLRALPCRRAAPLKSRGLVQFHVKAECSDSFPKQRGSTPPSFPIRGLALFAALCPRPVSGRGGRQARGFVGTRQLVLLGRGAVIWCLHQPGLVLEVYRGLAFAAESGTSQHH